MRVIVMRDYPDHLGITIDNLLTEEYTLTGFYGDTGLEWVLEYRGTKDTTLLELALSEYILDTATVGTVGDYIRKSI
jgi:hypothetical protein